MPPQKNNKMTYKFIHIPKVAGSSLLEIIKKDCPIKYVGHQRASDISFRNVSSLAFVRNPYDRLVSAYFYLINSEKLASALPLYKKIVTVYSGFKDFILNIDKDNLIEKILHLKPMHYWLCDDNKNILVKNIFKIENIMEIDKFLEGAGIHEKLSEIHTNTSQHKYYTEYLTKEITDEINRLYKLDFELFNYPML